MTTCDKCGQSLLVYAELRRKYERLLEAAKVVAAVVYESGISGTNFWRSAVVCRCKNLADVLHEIEDKKEVEE